MRNDLTNKLYFAVLLVGGILLINNKIDSAEFADRESFLISQYSPEKGSPIKGIPIRKKGLDNFFCKYTSAKYQDVKNPSIRYCAEDGWIKAHSTNNEKPYILAQNLKFRYSALYALKSPKRFRAINENSPDKYTWSLFDSKGLRLGSGGYAWNPGKSNEFVIVFYLNNKDEIVMNYCRSKKLICKEEDIETTIIAKKIKNNLLYHSKNAAQEEAFKFGCSGVHQVGSLLYRTT
tara:strand:- start:30 stop:731 length:702 start_codon:yes stop_codon:yes gene_type:complete